MIRTIFVAAAALSLSACGQLSGSNALDIPDIADGDVSEATMKEVVETLSSDAFEGRMPGTAGEEKTVAYLTDRFKAAGLKPGNNGSWVQDVPLVEITGRGYAPLTITGGKGNLALSYGTQWVGVSYREAAQTRIDASDMVFVGYGINAPERGWNDYQGLDVKGKTVVILVNDPDYQSETQDGTFNGRAMTYYGRWTYKFEEAARQGAAAALIVHDTEPASYGWNVVESSWTGPQAFPQRGENAPPLTIMNGWVSNSAAHEIFKAAGKDLDELSALARTKGFKAVPLGLKASTSF
ncbi:MAG: peptidase M28, partial [Alphaproteobacteria bacterium]